MNDSSSDGAGGASNLAGALVDTVSVGVGLFPLGVAFGLLVVQSGLDWWWAPA
jgi:predicted branched-subunit amino acid permease